MKRLLALAVVALALMAPAAFAQRYEKPNLSEDNFRPPAPRIAGSPIDYVLIPPGGEYFLHFDRQVRRIAIDDPDLIEAVLGRRGDGDIAHSSVVVLRAKAMGQTKVLIQGEIEPNSQNPNLLFFSRVAIGYRQMIISNAAKGFNRMFYDCTPLCIPTPGLEPKQPDYIIEQRVVGGSPPALPPVPMPPR